MSFCCSRRASNIAVIATVSVLFSDVSQRSSLKNDVIDEDISEQQRQTDIKYRRPSQSYWVQYEIVQWKKMQVVCEQNVEVIT